MLQAAVKFPYIFLFNTELKTEPVSAGFKNQFEPLSYKKKKKLVVAEMLSASFC